MKLTHALAMVTGGEKTASVTTPVVAPSAPSPSNPSDRLKQALAEAIAPAAQAKTASAPSPVADLTKIAADLSSAESDALIKEAQLYGAAVMDGIMARAAQYTEAAAKTAAALPAAPSSTETFDKFAAANPDLVKEAAELGYASTVAQLEKLNKLAEDKGWNDAVEQIHKHATDSFIAGFKDTLALMENAR